VSVLTLGTMTFGGRGGFAAVGQTDVADARRQVDMCLDVGVNLIDTAAAPGALRSQPVLRLAVPAHVVAARPARLARGTRRGGPAARVRPEAVAHLWYL
jgi:predicted aldo/keto reductase-like oxidoreductase